MNEPIIFTIMMIIITSVTMVHVTLYILRKYYYHMNYVYDIFYNSINATVVLFAAEALTQNYSHLSTLINRDYSHSLKPVA